MHYSYGQMEISFILKFLISLTGPNLYHWKDMILTITI